jgi:hypothetical protein
MNTQQISRPALQDTGVCVNIKLAALWAGFMFLYIYVDYFHLYMPGKIEDILQGRVFVFAVTQGFLLAALASVTIPALMIFVSVALPAQLNRRINMIVAAVYIPYTCICCLLQLQNLFFFCSLSAMRGNGPVLHYENKKCSTFAKWKNDVRFCRLLLNKQQTYDLKKDTLYIGAASFRFCRAAFIQSLL